ncbi:alpha/beta hydrolase [Mycobacterium sp. smrl_JER01]|uniref:alpha/beta hydrolase n=1 Tax=Mycobacterium sp. smrl_JER01 TaxID=3402633 RepID=UPI003AD45388
MTLTRRFKTALAITALGAAWVVRRGAAVRSALGNVPAELRTPALPFLTQNVTPRSLPVNRLVFRVPGRPGPGVRVDKAVVPGHPPVPVLVTRPTPTARSPRAAVLHLHAGGTIMGSPQIEAPLSGQLARELDAVVISPRYRLAPEHPFPAALDDCMAVLRWIHLNADELGVDPGRVALAGASAGGGLSAAVAQRAHDEGIEVRAQGLVYPMLDDRTTLRGGHGDRGRFVWTPQSNVFGWTAYLGRPPRLTDAPEYAVPARRTDLAGLAPAWVGVGDLDLFYDEAVAYARALEAAGVPCELVTVPGMYHGADVMAATAPTMREFRRGLVEHLRKYL